MLRSSFGFFEDRFAATDVIQHGEKSHAPISGSRVAMSPDTQEVQKIPVTLDFEWHSGLLGVVYRFPWERYGLHVGTDLVNTEGFTALGFVATLCDFEVVLGSGGSGIQLDERVELPVVRPGTLSIIRNNLDVIFRAKANKLFGEQ